MKLEWLPKLRVDLTIRASENSDRTVREWVAVVHQFAILLSKQLNK